MSLPDVLSNPTPRTAVVTGSTSGIGEAVARRLATDGWNVTVNGRGERAATFGAELASEGHRVIGVTADVGDQASVNRLIETTVETFGCLDALINNAGVPSVIPAVHLSAEHWRSILDTNLTGPFLCAQAAAKPMIQNGGGVIVNVGSILGHVGLAGRTAYTASKAGLLGLTRALAVEWAEHGIRVVSVDPAYVATPLIERTLGSGEGYSDQERRTPLGRLAKPSEVAGVIAFLLSDEAAYITGTSVAVDGGWLAYGGWE